MALIDILTEHQSEIQRLIGAILAGPADDAAKRIAAMARVREANANGNNTANGNGASETAPENTGETASETAGETTAEAAGEAVSDAASDAPSDAVPETPGEGTGESLPAPKTDRPPTSAGSDSNRLPAVTENADAAKLAPAKQLRVLVMPFTSEDESLFGDFPMARLAGNCIRHHLKLVPSLDVVGRHPLAELMGTHRRATPAELAGFADAAVVLTGELRREGDDLEVTMTLALAIAPKSAEDDDEGADTGDDTASAPEAEIVATDTWKAPIADIYLHTAMPALRLLRALGVPVRLAELEKMALPVTVNPEVALYWARALAADARAHHDASVRYYQLALDAQSGFRPAVDTLEAFAQPADDEWPEEAEKYRQVIQPLKNFRAVARHVDPSRSMWLHGLPLAERDDFSALGFATEGMMGQGLDGLIDALLEIPANAIVSRLVTGLLESHLAREDTPLAAKYVQWQMPLSHPANRTLWDREQKRAYLWLCRGRAELGLGHVEEAREIAKFVQARFPHLQEIAAYAGQFLNDLNQYDEAAFRAYRKEATDKFEALRPHLQRLYALMRLGDVPRNSPTARVRSWSIERPAVSWDTYAKRWEDFNRLARQQAPKQFALNPDDVEREILHQLAAEWSHAVTPNAKRLAYRPMAWLGADATDDLLGAWENPPNEPGHFATLMAGLVRAGQAPESERFAELVASDPLAAARFIRSLTPAVVTPDLRLDLEQDLDLPEYAAAQDQVTRIPTEWRPLIWQCVKALPKSAKTEASHLIAVLGYGPRADEEAQFIDGIAIAPSDAAVALLKLKSTSFPTADEIPADELALWCLGWRAKFKEQGPAAFVNLLQEGPGWMVVLGKQLADLVPLAMLAPTRLAGEVSKLRTARGLPERDNLFIEELASGAMAADKRPQSGKVARMILQQIIQRWPPWELSMGDHVWLFGTLERLKTENDPESTKVVLDLGRKTFDTLLDVEAPEFDERAITREKYYSDQQYLLVEILKRVVTALAFKQSNEARQLLADIVRKLKIPAQGNLIPHVETALARQGTAVLDTIENWLDAPDPFALSAAQRILGKLAGPEVDDRLIAWIGTERPVANQAAFETLRLRGPAAIPLLGSMLLSPNERVLRVACDLLLRLQPTDVPDDFDFSPLVELISSTDNRPLLRAACLTAAAHGVTDAFEPIAIRLVEWPPDDRLELLEGVAGTGHEKAFPFLIRALQSDYGDEANLAYTHLLRISGQTFPKDPAPWAMWWVSTAEDLTLPRAATAAATVSIPGISAAASTPVMAASAATTAPGAPAARRPAKPRVPKAGATAKPRVPKQPAQPGSRPAMPSLQGEFAAETPIEEAPPEMPELLADAPQPEDVMPAMPDLSAISDEDNALPEIDAVPEIGGEDFGVDDFVSLDGSLTKPKGFSLFGKKNTEPEPEPEPLDETDLAAPDVFGELDDIGDFDTGAGAHLADEAPDPFGDLDAGHTVADAGDALATDFGDAGMDDEFADLAPLDDIEVMDDDDIDVGDMPEDDLEDFPDEVSEPLSIPQMPTLDMGTPVASSSIENVPAAVPFEATPVLDAFAGVDMGDEFGFGEMGGAGSSGDDLEPNFGASDAELYLGEETTYGGASDGEESPLLAAPLNEVTGTFPLASLHGNGVGQWLSTDPDRFFAEGPVWFLIGSPDVRNFSFICPFHLLQDGFDVVLGPDERGAFARIRLDVAQFAPNEWWTLMVERQDNQAWFRIAERDNDWYTLDISPVISPLAAVGIAFAHGSDVAFGELVFETQGSDDHSRSGYLVRRR